MFDQVLIVSGPTVEAIDPVRFLSNRSSGKTGWCLANEAVHRGCARVVFVSGPVCLYPDQVILEKVESAEQMRNKVAEYTDGSAVIIMAAAVCDYRAAEYSSQKIKKKSENINIELVRNPDILAELGQKKHNRQMLVGFAAETQSGLEHARGKLLKKNLDLLVLNMISRENPAFGADFNQVSFISPFRVIHHPSAGKAEVARLIWDEIVWLAGKKGL